MTKHERILKKLLRQIADGVEQASPTSPIYSFHRYVLLHGKSWKNQSLPPEFRRGLPKLCFAQSQSLAKRRKLRYVEGFALSSVAQIPIHHAWCVDDHERVIDVTWKDGLAYFGIPFDLKFVEEQLRGTKGCSVIDNYEKGFPLLQKTA